MPLSAPADRQPIHARQVIMHGYRRADGLWDIEGRLVDTKSYDCPAHYRTVIPAGEPIHQMLVRVTVDDQLTVHKVEVDTEFAPFPMCGDITPAFSALEGLCMGVGFMREVRQRFGKVNGCVHIVELLGAMATTAFQTIYPLLARERGESGRPAVIDTCHALVADGPVVAQQWPQYSTQPGQAAEEPVLAQQRSMT
jgi:hypothetical protein